MKITAPFNREDFFGIFIQVFTAPTDRPLRDARGYIRRDLVVTLAVLSLSVCFWFLMNISFRPRFLPEPFMPSHWTFVSLTANLLFSFILLVIPKTRPLSIIPLIFTLFPLSFLAVSLSGEALRKLIPAATAAGGLDWKFIYDLLFFSVELVFICLFLFLSRAGNPLSLKLLLRQPLEKFIQFWEIVFLVVPFLPLGIIILQAGDRFPPDRLFTLLKYQVPFALLLGLKEELLFRWILLRKGEELLGSRLTAVCAMALIWSLYHGLFGEGVGSGFWPAFWVCIVSFWWSLLSYRYGSIWPAWAGHTAVELYGFYLMYIPFMG